MGIYHFGGVSLVRLMTEDAIVVEQSKAYIPWLLLMPVVGCAAFTWDGIYIGATASKAIRNSMIWAVAAFGMVWAAGLALLNLIDAGAGPERYDILAMHVLMAAYFSHLMARTVYLSIRYRISVLETPFCARP